AFGRTSGSRKLYCGGTGSLRNTSSSSYSTGGWSGPGFSFSVIPTAIRCMTPQVNSKPAMSSSRTWKRSWPSVRTYRQWRSGSKERHSWRNGATSMLIGASGSASLSSWQPASASAKASRKILAHMQVLVWFGNDPPHASRAIPRAHARNSGKPRGFWARERERPQGRPQGYGLRWAQFPASDAAMTLRILGRIFFTGLATMLPLAVTLAILIWLGAAAERVLGKIVKLMIPDHLYLPGMGILLGILLTLLVGLLARAWLFRRIFRYGDRLFNRIPLIKSVYGAVQDFMHFMSGSSEKQFDRVVTVVINGMRLMGFVTCAESETLPAPHGDEERIAVYFPMSYQIGGYT